MPRIFRDVKAFGDKGLLGKKGKDEAAYADAVGKLHFDTAFAIGKLTGVKRKTLKDAF